MSKGYFLHLTLTFDLWPMTLTFNPNLAQVKIEAHAKNQGKRSNGSATSSMVLTWGKWCNQWSTCLHENGTAKSSKFFIF